ncbi:hypothetical protein [Kordia sp.]|uniref:hypothetical protein n=1 Tax=Kordia sp. TaxID=1965332 RepID=UPI003D6B558C
MDRQHRLSFCSKCTHKKFDSTKGIICGLTNDSAKFYSTCKDFSGNKFEVDKTIKDRQLDKINEEEFGKHGKPLKITVWLFIRIIALIISLILLLQKLTS